MAKTGIKKYDDLPSRLYYVDVDATRAGYNNIEKIKNFVNRTLDRMQKSNLKTLDKAVKENKKRRSKK